MGEADRYLQNIPQCSLQQTFTYAGEPTIYCIALFFHYLQETSQITVQQITLIC